MSDKLPRMDYRQHRRARRLVHECCNYDGGNCLLLDDGEPCVCVQSIARGVERQEAARAHKEAKRQPPIAEQLKAAQKEAQEHRAPDGLKKKAPDRGDR